MGEAVSKYQVVPIDGVYTYGPAHDRRQEDAEEALQVAGDTDSSTVLTVFCAKAHTLATVHQIPTDDPELKHVIRISPPKRQTPDLRQVNRQLGLSGSMRAVYAEVDFVDPLHAPDDRDLEASCRCGSRTLDRLRLIDAIKEGQHEHVVS